MSAEDTKYQGACYCGAVEVSVAGDPAASAICHCHSCRKWHAAPLNAWSIWPSAQVTISGGETITSATDEASGRVPRVGAVSPTTNPRPE